MEKVRLILLSVITIAFILVLLVLSIKDKQEHPVTYMTEEEALELFMGKT